MAHNSELATDSVESVKFSFLTTEEVRKHSFKQITEVQLFDNLDRPIPGGLYDPALGPVQDRTLCKTCGQRSLLCPGHCGHIELVSPIYNPLLFTVLYNLLKKTCLSCHYFTDERVQVEKCIAQLQLVMKGDIAGANNMDSDFRSDFLSTDEDGTEVATNHFQEPSDDSKNLKGQPWTSLQYSHAMSIIDEFMKSKSKKCRKCGFRNPTLSQATFGWIKMETSNITTRRNVIRASNLDKPLIDEAEQESILGGALNSNGIPTAETEVDLDDMHSSRAVYDGTSDSPVKRSKDRVGNLPSEFLKQKKSFSPGHVLPSEVKDHIELLWDNETQLCSFICDIHRERLCISEKKRSYSIFFIEALLVPPIKFRPLTMGGDSVTNHPQTVLLSKILQSNIDLGYAHMNDRSKVVNRWLGLQQSVNALFGNKKSIGQKDNMGNGICQILEKKEGLFRQKMMGKRVNYSCRSVISPDPYLAVNEIGIPPCFALKLTYPERVTRWNVDKLRNAIINGPDVHPGATHYSDQSVPIKLPPNRKMRISISRKLPSSRGVVQLGRSGEHEHDGKVVYRHLQDGDIVLVNRQPTLHKPSLMAHVVRVLSGEKTLRMHYANCSTYNADFDGDEMNVHFPQDEYARAEAFQIVNANNQYIIPTSGDTKRGLIQDHIVAAVLLTKKDTFLTREEYTQLLYSSGVSAVAQGSFVGKPNRKVSSLVLEDEIELITPAILKPEPLWTGKQVITSLLNHMTKSKGLQPFSFEAKCTIGNEFLTSQSDFGDSSLAKRNDDPPFRICGNDLLNGVIDKAQFGKYGLIHTVQELYGSDTAGLLLSGFSRLFTVFLQFHGFTCGVDDLLLKQNIDKERRMKLKNVDKFDSKLFDRFVHNRDDGMGKHSEKADVQDRPLNANERKKLQEGIEKHVRLHGDSAISVLDKMMNNNANKLTNDVQNLIFPNKTDNQSGSRPKEIGLSKAFPKNCFFLMTKSGAKGSQVNFSQVSTLLGQQSLEGKRVPLMTSGKTLPCFPPWDPDLRAGGFITDCFLTGLRPQEYYFHCMAGREGLVDTAVKTSRSGYLQRCLVKNLECLKVNYDLTVRDADGSIVQFCYGEDGVDVHKTSFISKFNTVACNKRVVLDRLRDQWKDVQLMRSVDHKVLHEELLKKADSVLTCWSEKQHTSLAEESPGTKASRYTKEQNDLRNLMMLKYLTSLAQPGEPVGVIAAQSVGEPSTQMTLNTFHHAGQKDSNVTLGIPRLQEILMRASEKIQTPVMSCPLRKGKTIDDAERLAQTLRKVSLADIIESLEVSVLPFSVENNRASTIYKLKIKLYSRDRYPKNSDIKPEDCKETLESLFLPELERAINSHLTMISKISGIKDILQQAESGDLSEETNGADRDHQSKGKDEDNGSDDDEVEGTDAQKRKQQNTDEMEYEDGMENQNIEGEPPGFESEVDQVELEDEQDSDGDVETLDAEDKSKTQPVSEPKSSEKEDKSKAKRKSDIKIRIQKETDRSFYDNFDEKHLVFEAHFRFTNEPHILLSQIAQKAAKNVYIKKLAKINQCKVDDRSKRNKPPKIHTHGVDFAALWDMQEDLDVHEVKSNDIHAILQTYGVEAARTTIVKELGRVFKTYGISTDFRHLSLIADFMTQSGKYRPMSRHGMADSVSPFSKMTFETASAFIVNAAYRGETDNLESPSARICLGLPVKMGTGCFDLMQQVKV